LKTIVIIPSRYASQRLPAKPLALIRGKTLIERVYQRVLLAKGVDEVHVATDHSEIAEEVARFGGNVLMTFPDCASGTDRVAQAADLLGLDDAIILNVQGDEPLIEPSVIEQLATTMQDNTALRAVTPVARVTQAEDLTNPNIVTVAIDRSGDALYFSRHAVPFLRDGGTDVSKWLEQYPYFKHIGVYAYRLEVLRKFASLGEGPLERAERLEQLRLLEAGVPIRCVPVEFEAVAVDTPEDILRVESLLDQRGLA